MAGGGGGGDGEPEFQIAPMIDVLLVLLVFFVMITSAEVLKVDKNIRLPVSPSAKAREPEMAKHEMAVNVRYDEKSNKGVLVLDDQVYNNWPDVVPILQESRKRDERLRIVVRGDAAVPAGEIQRVMNLIGEAGIADIAFASSNK
ncbi:MAG: biopolymer transporter ExbD [Akkermansiaceae bacterium]|jgi:biopolymer transport protein ExbD|nr:biopolymer transporter ExbD [Akkermansiaceae bacterium]MBJ7396600.1 biopolymer transporter ExbD [Akkermansiaceae bacterium]MBJ7425128.1 biopolymer transporter ExbD [Akkermansiaceae bacterium]